MSEQETTNEHEVIESAKPKKPEDYYGTFDTTIVYDYKEYPDLIAGRCDNCGNAHFGSSIKNTIMLRTCTNCSMKKSI